MTQIDHLVTPKNPEAVQAQLQQLILTLTELTNRHTKNLPLPIFDLDEDAQQNVLDKLNPYVSFELAQNPGLKGIPLNITGAGIMFVSDGTGLILGGETISNGDVITGVLDDVCALPVPTVECLLLADDTETPIVDQTLSPVLMLKNGVYKTGLGSDGEYEVVHDLAIFEIGLPLAHYLKIDVATP